MIVSLLNASVCAALLFSGIEVGPWFVLHESLGGPMPNWVKDEVTVSGDELCSYGSLPFERSDYFTAHDDVDMRLGGLVFLLSFHDHLVKLERDAIQRVRPDVCAGLAAASAPCDDLEERLRLLTALVPKDRERLVLGLRHAGYWEDGRGTLYKKVCMNMGHLFELMQFTPIPRNE